MENVYVRNLTNPDARISLTPRLFGSKATEIDKLELLPKLGSAIVYILAHAVPNALVTGEKFITEAALADQLIAARPGQPTLVIIDACFAESFLKIAGVEWPPNFAFIFSCQAHERTWHTGDQANPGESIFSEVLADALEACREGRSASLLEADLVGRLTDLQTPVVKAVPAFLEQILCLSKPSALAS